MLQAAQVAFRFHGGGATGARRRDGLLVNAIGNIPRDKNTRMLALDQMIGQQVALWIRLQLALKSLCIRIMPNGDKDTADRKLPFFVRFDIAQRDCSHLPFFIRNISRHNRIPDRLYF